MSVVAIILCAYYYNQVGGMCYQTSKCKCVFYSVYTMATFLMTHFKNIFPFLTDT